MAERRVIDFRSDFLSRPTAAMLEAIVEAASRPASFELREDPMQRQLEAAAAEILGQEDALLCPTCTMANEIGLGLLAGPGDLVVAQGGAHIVTSEAGAPAALFGITIEALPGEAAPPLSSWEGAAMRKPDALRSNVRAFALENTHNRAGGLPLRLDYVSGVAEIARRNGVGLHLDGARLINAAVALGRHPAEFGKLFDTVSLSLNKGLGAPIGAVIAASRAIIERALVLRQRLGGGFRPAGMIAAAALCALRDTDHIRDDHRRAGRLADALRDAVGVTVLPPLTNIVVLQLAPGANPYSLCRELSPRGILAIPFGETAVRFATYRGITDDDIDLAAGVLLEMLPGFLARPAPRPEMHP